MTVSEHGAYKITRDDQDRFVTLGCPCGWSSTGKGVPDLKDAWRSHMASVGIKTYTPGALVNHDERWHVVDDALNRTLCGERPSMLQPFGLSPGDACPDCRSRSVV